MKLNKKTKTFLFYLVGSLFIWGIIPLLEQLVNFQIKMTQKFLLFVYKKYLNFIDELAKEEETQTVNQNKSFVKKKVKKKKKFTIKLLNISKKKVFVIIKKKSTKPFVKAAKG